MATFQLKKKWIDHIGARRGGGYGTMAPPLALALFCWCGYRYVLLKFQAPVCPFSTKKLRQNECFFFLYKP